MSKVALRFGCGKQSKNLERYLLDTASEGKYEVVEAVPSIVAKLEMTKLEMAKIYPFAKVRLFGCLICVYIFT